MQCLFVAALFEGFAEKDVVLDAVIEYPGTLACVGDFAVDSHCRRVADHLAQDSIEDGGLSWPELADDGHEFPFLDADVDITKAETDLIDDALLGTLLLPVESFSFDDDGVLGFVLSVSSDERTVPLLVDQELLHFGKGNIDVVKSVGFVHQFVKKHIMEEKEDWEY